MTADQQRLNKFLAHKLGWSRREADEAIAAGRVHLDGRAAQLGDRLLTGQLLELDGHNIDTSQPDYTYIAFHKPAGYVCSRRAQGDTPTIYSLLPPEFQRLKPVGRLDRDSSGLILLTDDGDFAFTMTHPKFHKTKRYEVELDKPLQPLHRQMIADHGLQLEDGLSRFEVERQHDGNDTAWRVTMSQGRNRQIRRTFAALGYQVIKLHRTDFGGFVLADLAVGQAQSISPDS